MRETGRMNIGQIYCHSTSATSCSPSSQSLCLPGPIRTAYYEPRTKNMTDEQREAYFVAKGKTSPMQRMGESEEIASVALFLVTEASSYITGESINVGGGLPLMSVGI